MRRYGLAALFAALLSMISGAASAALVERDFETPGDGLIAFDPVNSREWLDPSLTLLSQYVDQPETDPLLRAAQVDLATELALQETLPGGRFEGFTLATSEQFLGLLVSAGVNVEGYPNLTGSVSAANALAVRDLIETLGPTFVETFVGATRKVSNGVIADLDNLPPNPGLEPFPSRQAVFMAYSSLQSPISPNGSGIIGIAAQTDGYGVTTVGLLLTRVVVPEPSSSALLLLTTIVRGANSRQRLIT